MKCPQCRLVEMAVKEVKNNQVKLQCRKCGYETTVEEPKEEEESE
jgi:DNA-directed RNA polymerase subunit M/transcription elongation factor TFIIS